MPPTVIRRCFVSRRSCCSEPTMCTAAFVPLVQPSALLASRGDFFLLVYLLALGRFFLSLGALDGGSAFGGMGASREALVSSLAEAPFLLGLVALAISGKPCRHSRNRCVDSRAKYLQHFRRAHPGVHVSRDGGVGRDGPHARGQPDHPSRVDDDPRGNGPRILGAEPGARSNGRARSSFT